MKNYEWSLKFAPKLINFVNKIKRKGEVLKYRCKTEEIIQSFGRLCYLSIILLKDSHLFKIIELIISFCFKKKNLSQPLATAWALEFGHEIGIGGAVFEGDSELIINSLKAGENTIASVESLI